VTRSIPLHWGQHNLPTINLNGIAKGQLPSPTGFNRAIDAYITPLDAQFGLPSGANQPLKL
jgi:hypothetical protein